MLQLQFATASSVFDLLVLQCANLPLSAGFCIQLPRSSHVPWSEDLMSAHLRGETHLRPGRGRVGGLFEPFGGGLRHTSNVAVKRPERGRSFRVKWGTQGQKNCILQCSGPMDSQQLPLVRKCKAKESLQSPDDTNECAIHSWHHFA